LVIWGYSSSVLLGQAGEGIVGTDYGRDYLTNPRAFDGWLKANAVVGSVLAVAMLGAAFASFFSAGAASDRATEYSSVSRVSN
jgi:hypothetical protein